MKRSHKIFLGGCSLLAVTLLTACLWNFNSPSSSDEDDAFVYLPLDDSEYPYANLQRLVIQTENAADVRNRETKVPAKLQIYGKDSPESFILDLEIRGRGNSSWQLSKYGYRLEFEHKVSLFGMPADKSWNLLSNQRDKSLVRNYITNQLAENLGDEYVPRSVFVEVFLNKNYRGIFQLIESVKVSPDRVDIPESNQSFLLEKSSEDDQDKKHAEFYTEAGNRFFIKSPKKPSLGDIDNVKNHLDDFEKFILSDAAKNPDSLSKWIDFESLVRYYLIQEFTKNIDGNFHKSIYLSWVKNSPIHLGPVWDFDLAYGLSLGEKLSAEDYYAGNAGWFAPLFNSEENFSHVRQFWKDHHREFEAVADSARETIRRLTPAAKNEYKRWPILNEKFWVFAESFKRYEDTADSLTDWIQKRIAWLDAELLSPISESASYR